MHENDTDSSEMGMHSCCDPLRQTLRGVRSSHEGERKIPHLILALGLVFKPISSKNAHVQF